MHAASAGHQSFPTLMSNCALPYSQHAPSSRLTIATSGRNRIRPPPQKSAAWTKKSNGTRFLQHRTARRSISEVYEYECSKGWRAKVGGRFAGYELRVSVERDREMGKWTQGKPRELGRDDEEIHRDAAFEESDMDRSAPLGLILLPKSCKKKSGQQRGRETSV
ncbi:hypothetical protein EYR40_001661 [Pleurotus pulmonarius]|nr:hypothetical protein EYR40_001661 [Pleurotus pulmonarius]